MARCLALAARGSGHVSPNPRVGCVVVDETGAVLGEGWHGRYGGPHAEVAAIRDAEARHGAGALRAATLVVNLEPCAHVGKTPPCADLILEKGLPRVVVGTRDPFPAVDGRGIERLRAGGVDVIVGVLETECRRFNEAFFVHVETGRPLVVLKVAQTLDGFVATRTGHSRWVTGEPARARVHALRAALDAVLVGAGTARADDPALTVRRSEVRGPRSETEGFFSDLGPLTSGLQPLRVVLDRVGALPDTLRLFTDGHAGHTLAVVAEGARPAYEAALRERGGAVLRLPERDGHLDLIALLDALGAGAGLPGGVRPVQSVLVEAGPGLASALLAADLVDRLLVFVAPTLLGDGLRAFTLPGPDRMDDARRWPETRWETVGDDVLFTAYRRTF
jgi:diaminohydroxyphosphoribosylaminopyrimidine deaminase / 5-amino-6-(5-phosphoribosylamino)uracil reductase